MSLIEFKNLPDTSTPFSAEIFNHNFNEVKVESGSNSKGYWIKYADGTMIQGGTFTFEGATNIPLPYGGNRSNGITVSFPLSFVATPKSLIATSGSDTNDIGYVTNNSQLTKSSFAGFWWTINANNTTLVHTINWLAIGRWK